MERSETMSREAVESQARRDTARQVAITEGLPQDHADTGSDRAAAPVIEAGDAETDIRSRFGRILDSSRHFFGRTIGMAVDRSQEFLSHRNITGRKLAAAGGIGALAASAVRKIRHRREESQSRELSTRIRRRIPFGRE